MNIFITGGSGFIGRALRMSLEAAGHTTINYDLLNSMDILAGEDLRAAMLVRYQPVDVVVHLAAEVGKLNCETSPLRAMRVNVGGTLNVARLCAELDIPLVYCSTSEVYGDWGYEIVDEYSPLHEDLLVSSLKDQVSGMYALTKRWGEEVCRNYGPKGYGKLKIIRPTMPYGPGVPPGPGRRALDNLVWQAFTGQPMIVHRGAARSWCWIGDMADGIRTVIEADHSPVGNEVWVYNVGRDDDEVSMRVLALEISNLVRCSKNRDGAANDDLDHLIQVIDPPSRQSALKRIDCSALRQLGWTPKVELDDGLPRMVSWIKEWMEGPCESCDQLPPGEPFPNCKCFE